MKRLLALLLAVVLVAAAFAACSGKDSGGSAAKETEVSEDALDDISDISGKKITKATEAEEEDDDAAEADDSATRSSELSTSFDGRKDVAYVMVYNPAVYDENKTSNKTMSTGKLSKWIDTNANRADGLDQPSEYKMLSQKDLFAMGPDVNGKEVEQDRAGAIIPTYKQGEKKNFFYTASGDTASFKEASFTCAYVGKKCYIWTMDKGTSVEKSVIEKVAKEFDDVIFDKDTKMFGQPRFVEDGAKVSILLHPMSGGLMGYFWGPELLTENEVKVLANGTSPKKLGINTGDPVIHVCDELVASKSAQKRAFSTVAHEFQHMINFTSTLYTPKLTVMNTWLNEAMSGYIEDVVYPGVQKENGRYMEYQGSKTIRGGQSLYNFDSSKDIYYGVYCSVWLFSEYLNNAAGKDVFTKIHKYWRANSGTPTVAEAIKKSVSSSYQKQIDKLISYPSSLKFNSKDEEWLSKMTLDFYIDMMKYDKGDPDQFKDVKIEKLLYDEVNAANIEGGGRIIFATKDGKFSIPSDADKSLVYVGFDKNMNQITAPIMK